MNSDCTGKTNNVQYEKLEIDGDQVEAAPNATLGVASSSSIGGADEVSERQPFRSSCYNCLGCISLRAGVLLMSLIILVETLRKLIVVASIWRLHTAIPKIRYPAVFILAAVQILYAFVGIVAASTKNPLAAKLFREACLIGALCEVPLWIMFCLITSTIHGDKALVKLFVEVLFACVWIYFCQRQVAFSFYKKCSLEVMVEDVGQLNTRPITAV